MNDVKDHSGNLAGSNRKNNTHALRSSTLLYDAAEFFAKGGEAGGAVPLSVHFPPCHRVQPAWSNVGATAAPSLPCSLSQHVRQAA